MDEEEYTSSDVWSDMIRSDACTAEETFHIMEQNIHKQFRATSKLTKVIESDLGTSKVHELQSIPHRKSDRGRVRTISSINDQSIVDLLNAKAPMQIVRKRPSHYRPGQEVPPLRLPQKDAGSASENKAPAASTEPSTPLSKRMQQWFQRSFSFRRADNISATKHDQAKTNIDYLCHLSSEYSHVRDTDSIHQHAIQCLAAVIVSFVADADTNFHLDATSPAYGALLDNPETTGPSKLPSILAVQMFISNIYTFAQLEFDALICALVYIDRIRVATRGALCICHENWQSILFGALVVSSHMWDDFGMINDDLSLIYTNYPTIRINTIERIFVEILDYRLTIRPDEFAKYFYHVHRIMLKASTSSKESSDSATACPTGTPMPMSPTSCSSIDLSKSLKDEYCISAVSPRPTGMMSRIFSFLRSPSTSKIYCESSDDVPRSD